VYQNYLLARLNVTLLALCACASAQPADYNPLYASGSAVFTKEPNALLVEAIRDRPPGRALDVGMGQGRNALFLAKKGWEVTGFDSADEGIRLAKAQASQLGLKLDAQVTTSCSLTNPPKRSLQK